MTIKLINTFAFAAMVIINALANLLPIGGNTTGQISQAYPNLFTPAPITFAVWGLIYLLMGVFVVYQWGVFDGGVYSTKVREKVGLWFAVSCALNIIWIFLWHYKKIEYSVICMLLLLVSLIVIRRRVESAGGNFLQRSATKVGFSIYYGWIIAATIANVCVLLTKVGWNGWGLSADFWTIAVLLTGAVIASAVALFSGDWIAAMTVMWAYAGILIRHISGAYFGGSHPIVIAAAFFSEALILAVVLMPRIEQIIGKLKCASPQ